MSGRFHIPRDTSEPAFKVSPCDERTPRPSTYGLQRIIRIAVPKGVCDTTADTHAQVATATILTPKTKTRTIHSWTPEDSRLSATKHPLTNSTIDRTHMMSHLRFQSGQAHLAQAIDYRHSQPTRWRTCRARLGTARRMRMYTSMHTHPIHTSRKRIMARVIMR